MNIKLSYFAAFQYTVHLVLQKSYPNNAALEIIPGLPLNNPIEHHLCAVLLPGQPHVIAHRHGTNVELKTDVFHRKTRPIIRDSNSKLTGIIHRIRNICGEKASSLLEIRNFKNNPNKK